MRTYKEESLIAKNYRRSSHPEDWEDVTTKVPKARRVNGKRVCYRTGQPCEFLNLVVRTKWYIIRSCIHCNRYEYGF